MSSGGIEIPITFDAQGSKVTLEQLSGEVKGLEKDTKKLAASTKQASSGLGGLAKQAAVAGAAFLAAGAAVRFITQSIAAQSVQIAAVNKLNLALANQGQFTAEASQELQDFAAELQKVTTVGDETIISVQGQLASFGLLGEELKRATVASLDFAAATGSELRAAADLVGKAFVGETGSLSRYGIVLEDNLDKSEKFEAAVSQLEARFSGSAQAATLTFTGGMEQLSNTFGDTQEAFGKLLGFVTSEGTKSFGGLATILERLSKFFGEDLIITIGFFRATFADGIAVILDGLSFLGESLSRFPGIEIDTTSLRQAAADQRALGTEIRIGSFLAADSVGVTAEFTNAQVAAAAGAKVNADALKEQEKRLKAVQAATISLTGALDPAKFSILLEAIEGIGDASAIAADQLPKLAEQLIQAQAEGQELPAIATEIIDRFLEFETAAASVEVLNAELAEQARILAILGPGVEGLSESFVDLQQAIGIEGGIEFVDSAQLLVAIEGFRAIADEAELAGVEVEGLGEAFGEALKEAAERGLDLSGAISEIGDDAEVSAEKSVSSFETLGDTMQGLEAIFNQLGIAQDSFFGGLLSALTALPSAFGTITEGLGSLFDGLGEGLGGGLLDSIAGVLGDIGVAGQIATAAIGIGSAIVGLFRSDPIKKAQEEAGEILGVGISRALAESIAEQADTLGIAVADAALLALPDAIAESGQAAGEFAGEILQLFDAVAEGSVPAAEGIAALGESFSAVATEALEAGRVGDVALRSLIARSRELGQEVPEISAFVGQQLDQATAGIGRFVDSLSFVSDEAFQTLGADAAVIFGATFDALVSERGLVGAVDALEGSFGGLREVLVETLGEETAAALTAPFAAAFALLGDEQLRPLLEGIDGLSQAFSALANADFLNIDQFRAAERASATLFDELIAGGADTNTALTAIAPSIQAAIAAAEQFGIPISEDTQRLKELAEQNGITFATDPQQAQLDVLLAIAEVLGAVIPESARRAQDAITGLGQGLEGVTDGLEDPFDFQPGGGVPGAAGVPAFPGGPAAPTGAAVAAAVQNIEFNVSVQIDENPFAAAETREQLRQDTIKLIANSLEDRVAAIVAAQA